MLSLWQVKDLLAELDAATTERALRQLRNTITEHDTGSGVLFDSRAWIVTASGAAPRRTVSAHAAAAGGCTIRLSKWRCG